MFIANEPAIKVGDRVSNTMEIRTMAGKFTIGHIFTIIGETDRGWVLQDDDGNGANDVGWSGFIKVNS